MKKIDFYFDVGSPYSYLAHTQLKKYEKDANEKVNYLPILVGGLHKLAGITAPGLIPTKAKYLIKDCKMWADKYKIKYQFNRYFPIRTVNLMRACLIAEKENSLKEFVDKCFEAIWVESLNLNDEKIFNKFIESTNTFLNLFSDKISDQKTKDELIKRTSDSFNKGIFGVPSFIVNGKMFWGQDRLEFVLNEAKK
ncbi:MAG: 2-hydroxychromene-2-carboxylate isomerase [Candidatus Fonsibacter sp.]|jgi:2-hydroxychromene-2-carboxylate isomerase